MTIHQVTLTGYITEKKAMRVLDQLATIANEYPCDPIEFIINSQGGSTVEGNAIYSELFSLSQRGEGLHHVTTKVRGMCGSAATLIYQAGDLRVGGKIDYFVFHETLLTFNAEFVSTIRHRLKQVETADELYYDAFMDRATITRKQLKALCGPVDRTVPMDLAIEYGLADEFA